MAKVPGDIRSLARSHTATAIRVLAGIMGEPKAPASARVTAAQVLLDRGWGKPEQTSNLNVRRLNAREMSDDELAAIAVGRSDGDMDEADTPVTH